MQLGTLVFAGPEHWACFNFPKSTALFFLYTIYPSFSGILVFIGLCGTFLHANSTVKRQVSLKVFI